MGNSTNYIHVRNFSFNRINKNPTEWYIEKNKWEQLFLASFIPLNITKNDTIKKFKKYLNRSKVRSAYIFGGHEIPLITIRFETFIANPCIYIPIHWDMEKFIDDVCGEDDLDTANRILLEEIIDTVWDYYEENNLDPKMKIK